MTSQTKNRYKFTFGDKPLVLTTDKDNLFMEEVERLAKEKYEAIKAQMPKADNETIAILLAINSLSLQLSREINVEALEEELAMFKSQKMEVLLKHERGDDDA